jgi:hypothetical protein
VSAWRKKKVPVRIKLRDHASNVCLEPLVLLMWPAYASSQALDQRASVAYKHVCPSAVRAVRYPRLILGPYQQAYTGRLPGSEAPVNSSLEPGIRCRPSFADEHLSPRDPDSISTNKIVGVQWRLGDVSRLLQIKSCNGWTEYACRVVL